MDTYIYLLIFSISMVLFNYKFRRIINFAFIFNAVWCVFGAISTLGVFDMRIPVREINVYAWTFVGIVDLLIFLFAKKESDTNKLFVPRNAAASYSLKYANIIQAVSLILISVLFCKSLRTFLNEWSFSSIRSVFFGKAFKSKSIYVDFMLRSVPVAMMEGLVVFYVFTAFIKGEMKWLIYATLNCLIVTMCSGGRYTLMLLFFSVVICIITLNWKKGLSADKRKRYLRMLIGAILILVLFFVAITVFRGQDLFKNIFAYYSGSLSLLDYIMAYPDPERFGFAQGLTYGYLTFGAFIEPVVLFLKVVFKSGADVPAYYFDRYCQRFCNISTGEPLLINNNTTVIYYFLRDFGKIGIIIGAVFLGTLLVYFYNNMKKGGWFSGLFFVYFANVMFNSLMTYQFFGRSPMIIIFTLFVCSRRGASKGKNEFR